MYDSEATSFGRWVEHKSKEQDGTETSSAPAVYSLQARPGAATTVLGFLSRSQGSATILTNARGFVAMVPSLAFAECPGRIVVQVSGAGQRDSEGCLRVADHAPATLCAASFLRDDWTVVYTSDQYEAADVATATYLAEEGNVVHVFDGAFSAREVDYGLAPSSKLQGVTGTTVMDVLAAAHWGPLAYVGPTAADAVLVVPNTSLASSAKLAHTRLSRDIQARVGVMCVRIPNPWDEDAFRSALPRNVTRVAVLDVDHGLLASQVEGALLEQPVHVSSLAVPVGEQDVKPLFFTAALQLLASGPATWDQVQKTATDASSGGFAGKLLTVLNMETSASTFLGSLFSVIFADAAAQGVGAAKVLHCRTLDRYDNFHGPQASGVVRSDVVFGPKSPSIASTTQQGCAQTLVIPEPSVLLSSIDALSCVAPGGVILLDTSDWEGNAAENIEEHLIPLVRRRIAQMKLKLFSIDAASVLHFLQAATKETLEPQCIAVVLAAAALQIHLNASKQTLLTVIKPTLDQVGVDVDTLVNLVSASVTTLPYDEDAFAGAAEAEGLNPPTLSLIEYNGLGRLPERGPLAESAPRTSSWASAAWQRLYPEAYGLDTSALRADLSPEPVWEVEVTENRRLTPMDYDRNVFHLELSTRGTDLRYEVGQALGVHGWNDEQEVEAFLRFTGLVGEQVVSLPSVGGKAESLTLFQILLQRKDIFGRPRKAFYAALADLAVDPAEVKWLRFVASAEGSTLFKKYAEVETVTYADVLRMFPSVLGRLSAHFLLDQVEDIQPRHYSIASAQAAVGESVHLLIVTVDWTTPSGAPRFGQCTRYLSKLRVGDKVTVSLRPSVMKLPPLTEQPIIMAGLGTGAAPFRAFLQARAAQKAQGSPIGPLVYYFGSRYRSKEYLYGEELEAFQRDGILARLGLAFSRDQRHKVYIQDKIEQDAHIMADYLAPELKANSAVPASLADTLSETHDSTKGYFYLCGPYVCCPCPRLLK